MWQSVMFQTHTYEHRTIASQLRIWFDIVEKQIRNNSTVALFFLTHSHFLLIYKILTFIVGN